MSTPDRPPLLIGILGNQRAPEPFVKKLEQLLQKKKKECRVLPLAVERRYLKNTLACMKLVDIHALVIQGKHRQQIVRYLERCDRFVRHYKRVDVIFRRGKNLSGTACADPTVVGLGAFLAATFR